MNPKIVFRRSLVLGMDEGLAASVGDTVTRDPSRVAKLLSNTTKGGRRPLSSSGIVAGLGRQHWDVFKKHAY